MNDKKHELCELNSQAIRNIKEIFKTRKEKLKVKKGERPSSK